MSLFTKIYVRLTPNAKKTEIVATQADLYGKEILQIRVAAPPTEGKANRELLKFLAKHLKVAKSQLSIVSGETSRDKVIQIAK